MISSNHQFEKVSNNTIAGIKYSTCVRVSKLARSFISMRCVFVFVFDSCGPATMYLQFHGISISHTNYSILSDHSIWCIYWIEMFIIPWFVFVFFSVSSLWDRESKLWSIKCLLLDEDYCIEAKKKHILTKRQWVRNIKVKHHIVWDATETMMIISKIDSKLKTIKNNRKIDLYVFSIYSMSIISIRCNESCVLFVSLCINIPVRLQKKHCMQLVVECLAKIKGRFDSFNTGWWNDATVANSMKSNCSFIFANSIFE